MRGTPTSYGIMLTKGVRMAYPRANLRRLRRGMILGLVGYSLWFVSLFMVANFPGIALNGFNPDGQWLGVKSLMDESVGFYHFIFIGWACAFPLMPFALLFGVAFELSPFL